MSASAELKPDENSQCDECGAFGATEIAGQKLCPNCLANCGSCCAGQCDVE